MNSIESGLSDVNNSSNISADKLMETLPDQVRAAISSLGIVKVTKKLLKPLEEQVKQKTIKDEQFDQQRKEYQSREIAMIKDCSWLQADLETLRQQLESERRDKQDQVGQKQSEISLRDTTLAKAQSELQSLQEHQSHHEEMENDWHRQKESLKVSRCLPIVLLEC